MTDITLTSRIELLETRLMHQEVAIEELTQTLLRQEQLVSAQRLTIERLDAMMRSLSATHHAPQGEEPPPPHY